MSIVTLSTDIGQQDYIVGAIKGDRRLFRASVTDMAVDGDAAEAVMGWGLWAVQLFAVWRGGRAVCRSRTTVP